MVDVFTPEKRSAVMARIRGIDTKPEMRVRKLVHGLGFRYRLHRRDLPGSPDLVFPGRRRVIFVHGCFWHRHNGCKYATTPGTRRDFWERKFRQNVDRDRRVQEALEQDGWGVLVIWECEARDVDELSSKILPFFGR